MRKDFYEENSEKKTTQKKEKQKYHLNYAWNRKGLKIYEVYHKEVARWSSSDNLNQLT